MRHKGAHDQPVVDADAVTHGVADGKSHGKPKREPNGIALMVTECVADVLANI